MSGQHSVWMKWGVGLLTLLILFTIFLIPLNSDSDIYQSMAVDLWRYGKLPYMGSWDQNFPGIVYLHFIPLTIFGNSDISFRVLDLIANAMTAYLLFSLSRRLVPSDVALLAPLMYAIYYVSGGWWAIGQRDVFAGCFLLCASLVYVKREGSVARTTFVIGVLIGCAAFIRPTYALFLPLLALRQFSLKQLSYLGIGFTIPFALFVVGFSTAGGDLREIILAVFTYNTQAYGGLAEPWSALLARTAFQLTLWVFSIIGLIATLKRQRRDAAHWVMVVGVITGLVSTLVMRKFFVYHFHVLFSFLIVFALVGLQLLSSRLNEPRYRIALLATSVVLLLYAFYPRHLIAIAARSEGSLGGKIRSVQSAYSLDSMFGRYIDLKLSDYLGRERNVELVSVTPAVHWMNELDQPSRFTMIHPLTITGPSGNLTPFQHEWRAEYLSALEKRKPRIIALADGPGFLMKYIRRTPKDLALEIQGENGQLGFAQLLEQHYVLDTTIGGYYIYKRNAP